MYAARLRCEHMKNPMGIDNRTPFLSWQCEDGIVQTAYEITAEEDGKPVWTSGRVDSAAMHARFEGELRDRQRITWRVRLWDESQEAGAWSEAAVFEMGLLRHDCLRAKWINPEPEEMTAPRRPASYLKKSFKGGSGNRFRLYITCHGLYTAYINGVRAGDFVLAPGTGNYGQKLAYQTYDVTGLIRDGANELLVVLGDGWYRGCTGVDGDRNLYGTDIALLCQVEQDGEVICISDESWQASQCGPIRENDMQQGECCDGRLKEIENWHPVREESFGTHNLACSGSVPVREWESLPGTIKETPNGERVIDFGQNLAGYVELSLTAHAGDRIVLIHGETLDENGNFTNENFQPGKRHKEGGIRQRTEYICEEGHNRYKPSFCIFGFRYAKLETSADLSDAVFTAHAVYSEMEETGTFSCSDSRVNRLVHNCIWSQKSNFCDVPTDCPTRERAGWTGDAGVFTDTGLYLADCYPVLRKWLGECRLGRKKDGRLYNIAPPNGRHSVFSELLSGSVGWGDACIIVPYTLYRRYGDRSILEENYEMMKGWLAYLLKRARKSRPGSRFKKNPYRRYTIDTGTDYGEWCEPGAGIADMVRKPSAGIATAYLSYSGKMLAQIAAVLGEKEDARYYEEVSEAAKKAYRHTATRDGKIVSKRQCEYVRALAFSLLDEAESRQAAADLNELVRENDYHLNTGFLSTPFLCEVLTQYGYTQTAYRLLLKDTVPGWLYAVQKGATTIWENWDGIREDGTVHASLNHYSYGSVSGWLFGGVCGIRLENGCLTIRPAPCPLLAFARAEYQSPIGRIVSGWAYDGEGGLNYEFVIPANVRAEVTLPDGRTIWLTAGEYMI